MAEPTYLLDVPGVVMKCILRKVDFRSIQILRKVCRDLRNFIDDYKPESHLERVSVRVTLDSIKLDMPFNIISVRYQKNEKGCLVTGYNSKEKLFAKMDFVTVFLEDFRTLFKFQRLPVRSFYFYFELFSSDDHGFLERMKKSLKSWDHPIPIKRFNSTTMSQEEIMSILPYFDPKLLDSIELSTPKCDRVIPIEMYQIVKLDQWKNGKTVIMSKLETSISLHHFSHFTKVMIVWNFLSGDDVALLKNMFLESAKLKSFQINAKYGNLRQYCVILGQATTDRNRFGTITNTWTCDIPNSDRCLKFSLSGAIENWSFSIDGNFSIIQ